VSEPAPQSAAGATSSSAVDAVLSQLEVLDDLPVGEHVEVFDGVHRSLQDALASLDEA
jgi:hypothetical protein